MVASKKRAGGHHTRADPGGLDGAGEAYVVFGSTSGFPAAFELESWDARTGVEPESAGLCASHEHRFPHGGNTGVARISHRLSFGPLLFLLPLSIKSMN